MAALLRILIGLILLVSGFEKLISPYQNFQYVIQAYQFLPPFLETFAAIVVPWVELILGLFMVLGLWLNWALPGALLLFVSFITLVGQALLRHLAIDQCGCFGGNIHIAPEHIIIFDSATLLVLFWLFKHPSQTKLFSLDQYLK